MIECRCFSSRFYLYPTLFVIHTRRFITHPQAMRKLNPTNKPRTPPQSARRELRGNANSSLLTRILLLTNIGHTSVVPLICFFNIAASWWFNQIRNRLTSSQAHLILHKAAWHEAFCFINELIFPQFHGCPIHFAILDHQWITIT